LIFLASDEKAVCIHFPSLHVCIPHPA